MPVLLSSLAQLGGNTEAQAPPGYPDQQAQFCPPQVASSRQSARPPTPAPLLGAGREWEWGDWGFLLQPFPSHGEETSGKDSQVHCSFDPSRKHWEHRENFSLFIFLFTKLGERVLKNLWRRTLEKPVGGHSPPSHLSLALLAKPVAETSGSGEPGFSDPAQTGCSRCELRWREEIWVRSPTVLTCHTLLQVLSPLPWAQTPVKGQKDVLAVSFCFRSRVAGRGVYSVWGGAQAGAISLDGAALHAHPSLGWWRLAVQQQATAEGRNIPVASSGPNAREIETQSPTERRWVFPPPGSGSQWRRQEGSPGRAWQEVI